MKSLNRLTPLVRIKRSSGGSPAVNRFSSIVSVLMVSGSGKTGLSWLCVGGESGLSVVEEETDSSASDIVDGVGELARK
jgi:hypothetical protein